MCTQRGTRQGKGLNVLARTNGGLGIAHSDDDDVLDKPWRSAALSVAAMDLLYIVPRTAVQHLYNSLK